jgi:DNA-binding XRE family transcriptional regulator
MIPLCSRCRVNAAAFLDEGSYCLDCASLLLYGRHAAHRGDVRERRLQTGDFDSAFVGPMLIEFRLRSGMTQCALAAASNVGERTISSFETGRRAGTIKLAQFAALCVAMGRRPSEVMAEMEEAVARTGAGEPQATTAAQEAMAPEAVA